jgi:hypothetical protein
MNILTDKKAQKLCHRTISFLLKEDWKCLKKQTRFRY